MGAAGLSAKCRYCCKSLKSRSDNFPGRKQDRPCSPINMASGLLPKLPVSSSLCDEVPHIFIPKSHLEPREYLISSAKRLLQQYRPIADKMLRRSECPLCADFVAEVGHFGCAVPASIFLKRLPITLL